MAAIVTNAWDVMDESASYADVSSVEELLTGILTDIEGTSLAQVLSSAERDVLLPRYLGAAAREIHRRAGRDFVAHEAVEIAVSGTGMPTLDLSVSGFVPLVEVVSVSFSRGAGATLPDNSVVFSRGGMVQLSGGIWPKGFLNVNMVVSFGFRENDEKWPPPPAAVADAQAMLAAARILEYIQATKNADGIGGVQVIQYGDMQIRHFDAGRFKHTIESWKQQAYNICRFYRGIKAAFWEPAQTEEYGERIAER